MTVARVHGHRRIFVDQFQTRCTFSGEATTIFRGVFKTSPSLLSVSISALFPFARFCSIATPAVRSLLPRW